MSNRTMPSTSQLLTPIVAGAAVLLAAASLTGCSQLLDSLHKVHQESFPSYSEAADAWVGVDIPSWIPDDATELRNYATLDESQSVVGVTSASQPVGCTDAPRQALPFATTDWAPAEMLELPDGGLLSDVFRCGDYEVVPYGDGWVGWFSADEAGQTPS
ncbi:MAG: hypothetical protein ACTHMQ_02625 [Protaetiibacter sp.]